ncbi:MAG: antitoxin Xre/MbcA/ParS toxin-binding domain-containing protein [Marinomonas foliarum]
MNLAKKWINSQTPALGGQVPANILYTIDGREIVAQI